MNAYTTSDVPKLWSKTSIAQLKSNLHTKSTECLRNLPTKLIKGPTCGNGFVEYGEECDCGLPSVCNNNCCDPTTCKLRSKQSCATGQCCNLKTCQPHKVNFECRPSKGECDMPEYCNGKSEHCPTDKFKPDTTNCQNGKAYCYRGQCKTRDDHCNSLWGLSVKSSDLCYERNIEGSEYGNCDYDRKSKHLRKCTINNIFCGMLQCSSINEEFIGSDRRNKNIFFKNYVYERRYIPCRTVIYNYGLPNEDPSTVPDGTKCGDGRLCYQQECVSLDHFRMKKCQNNCNGKGKCNKGETLQEKSLCSVANIRIFFLSEFASAFCYKIVRFVDNHDSKYLFKNYYNIIK